jgi:cytochrome c biogenesis protein ResB
MNNYLQAFWNFITSRNLAIVLLIIVTAMLAIGAFLPNPVFLSEEKKLEMHFKNPTLYWLGERYNSQTLASGNTFGFIGVFLILSTALCSIDRLVTKRRAKEGAIFTFPFSTAQKGEIRYFKNIDSITLENYGSNWFKKQKMDIAVQDVDSKRIIVGSRGKAGFWGSIFFHFILITALMGLVIYYFGSYRATLSFTEGQSYRLHKDRLVHIIEEPLWGLDLPDAEVGLVKQYSLYAQDSPLYPIEHVAVFQVNESRMRRPWNKEVRINDPLVIDGRQFLLQRGGFSPRILIMGSDGKVIFDRFVALRDERGTSDNVSIQEINRLLTIKFYPDFIRKDKKLETKTLEVKNPFFMITIYQEDSVLFKELVPFKSEVSVEGYTISFPEVRRWVEMELVGEPGIGFFFMVSFAGLIGVFVRIIDPDERIYIILEEMKSGVNLTSYTYSKHFSGLIEDRRAEMVSYIEERKGLEDSSGQGFKGKT